jgi:SAM-dependent methyltransferase
VSAVVEPGSGAQGMLGRYARRGQWLYRLLRPPVPLVHNPREPVLTPGAGPSILVGAAGSGGRHGFIGLDLFAGPGVHLRANLERLPFPTDTIAAIECDAVLEHVRLVDAAVREMHRVMRPGALLHVVVPFNHPFHEYPTDYRRWTIDGLRELLAAFEVIECGVRTGPTATLLTFGLEYVKVVSPRPLKKAAYAAAGWILWPLRYLDLLIYRAPGAHILANSIYAIVRKRTAEEIRPVAASRLLT